MGTRPANLLERQAKEGFTGREAELEALAGLLNPAGPHVLHLSGVAGIGKSLLVDVFAARAREAGATVVRMDCRTIEPSVHGFLTAAAAATGATEASLEGLADRIATLDNPVVLVLDTYELFWLMDPFIRLNLCPVLPESARVLLAGRQAPVPAWLTSPEWRGLFTAISLGPLTEREARDYLGQLGLDAEAARRVNGVAHGHPLALTIAARAGSVRGPLRPEDAAAGVLMDTVAREYLASVADPSTREAVEAGSVVRRTTEPLLRAMLPGIAPADAVDRLTKLPFVERAADGLFVHDAVRDAVATSLEATDPERHRRYRAAAWHQLRDEVAHATPSTIWRYTADILYLLRNPVVREAFFPSGYQPMTVEPARATDEHAILAIAARHEGPEGASAFAAWWERHQGSFRVCRNSEGKAQGFLIALPGNELSEEVINADPIAAAWAADVAANGGAASSLLLRRSLDFDEGEASSGSRGALAIDVKRTYMEMRPRLRYIYLCAANVANLDWCDPLGFEPLPSAERDLDGRPIHSVRLDMGTGSVDGWLSRIVAEELGIEDVSEHSLFDADARELVLGAERVPLTPLEYGVMSALAARAGRPVSRADLIEQVWGYEANGTSNVVDAVILSLRRKLGPHANAIETVRGTGYRYKVR